MSKPARGELLARIMGCSIAEALATVAQQERLERVRNYLAPHAPYEPRPERLPAGQVPPPSLRGEDLLLEILEVLTARPDLRAALRLLLRRDQ
jgi:hypothetical protein